ncbi:MAG TPA: methyltransferase [Kofleriaceae bacterium]
MKPPPVPIVKLVLGATRLAARLHRAVTPAQLALVELTSGAFIVSCAILTATRLGVPDALVAGAKTARELATELGLCEEPLYRMLRALAHAGVLAQRSGRFELTSISKLLARETAGSMRDILLLGAEPWHHRLWGELEAIVRTGEPAHDRVLGGPLFAHLERDAGANDVFNRAMVAYSAQTAAAVATAYDLSRAKRIVDVGGGIGHLLGAVLARHAEPRGVLFDLPHVVAGAPAFGDRVEIAGGDFFADVPGGGDVYVLMNILHNWADADAARILASCRRAIAPTGKLAIVEMIVPEDRPDYSAIFDLEMLVLFRGGRERTRAELAALLADNGFALDRVIATASPASVIEAVPA